MNPYRSEPRVLEHGGALTDFASDPHRTQKIQEFALAYAEMGDQDAARKLAGIPHQTFYDWLDADTDSLRTLRDSIRRSHIDRAAGTMFRRGVEAPKWDMAAFYALMAWLRANDPEHWVEKRQEQHDVHVTVHVDELLRGLRRQEQVIEGEVRELPSGEGAG